MLLFFVACAFVCHISSVSSCVLRRSRVAREGGWTPTCRSMQSKGGVQRLLLSRVGCEVESDKGQSDQTETETERERENQAQGTNNSCITYCYNVSSCP